MSKYLVTVETVKIKDFIFSTNKLKLIRGASYLLDYLNQVEVPAILKKNGLDEEKDFIYIGAGNAKFFVDSKEKAEKITEEIKAKYREEAPNAKVATSYRETTFDGEKSNGEKIWETMDKLAQDVAIEKSKGFPTLNIDLPFIQKCSLCGNNPVEISAENLKSDLKILNIELSNDEIHKLKGQIENLSEDGKICEECLRKLIFSNKIKTDQKEIGFYGKIVKEFKEELGFEINIDTEVEDYEGSKSFIGFMYSDGDGLGDFLKNISKKFISSNSEKEYIKFLKEFSKVLDTNTKDALLEVLKKKSNVFFNRNNIVGEFLIVGGDDVCAVFSSDLAIEISNEFQKEFEKRMAEYTVKKGIETKITSSSGVVIAKSKTPMFHLFDQALGLQKRAKAKRHENKKMTTGYIDFEVIGSEGCVNIGEFRKGISSEDNKVIERPYSIAKEAEGTKSLDCLIKEINAFKASDFPRTKLRYIYDLKRDNSLEEYEKKMEFINILSKMQKEHIALIDIGYDNYEKFNENFSNIFDILELYDFIGGENNEN